MKEEIGSDSPSTLFLLCVFNFVTEMSNLTHFITILLNIGPYNYNFETFSVCVSCKTPGVPCLSLLIIQWHALCSDIEQIFVHRPVPCMKYRAGTQLSERKKRGKTENETDTSVHCGMDSIVYSGTGICTGRRAELRGYGVDHRSHSSCDVDDACRAGIVLRRNVQV